MKSPAWKLGLSPPAAEVTTKRRAPRKKPTRTGKTTSSIGYPS